MGLQRPEEQRIPAKEVSPQAISVPVPQHLTPETTSKDSPPQAPHDQRQRVVYPDQHCGLCPGNIVAYGVVAIDHPGITGRRRGNPPAKLLRERRRPVWLPVQGVQLDMWYMEQAGKVPSNGGLARPGNPDDQNPGSADITLRLLGIFWVTGHRSATTPLQS